MQNSQPHKLSNLVIILIAIAGFISSAYAIWWWQYKDLRTFTGNEWQNRAIHFYGDELRHKLKEILIQYIAPGKINVINFIQPGCTCNTANTQHVNELSNAFGEKINVITIIPTGYASNEVDSTLTNVTSNSLLTDLIPAAPAAAVIDQNRELIYFGTYSTGVLCGEGDNLVEARLQKLINGERVEKWLNTRGYGCFCDYK